MKIPFFRLFRALALLAASGGVAAAAAENRTVFEVDHLAVLTPISQGRVRLSGVAEVRFTGRIQPHENSVNAREAFAFVVREPLESAKLRHTTHAGLRAGGAGRGSRRGPWERSAGPTRSGPGFLVGIETAT